jgi:acetylornithine/succinyldiaminopimelate/putrescine aminotransferase
MARAGSAAQRLDEYMSSVRGTGMLREFNRAYRRRRMAATARGEGFMTFKTAEARLRNALVPLLTGDKPVATASLFAEVFKTEHRDVMSGRQTLIS